MLRDAWYRKSTSDASRASAHTVRLMLARPDPDDPSTWARPCSDEELAKAARSAIPAPLSIWLLPPPLGDVALASSPSANLILHTNSMGMWAARAAALPALLSHACPYSSSAPLAVVHFLLLLGAHTLFLVYFFPTACPRFLTQIPSLLTLSPFLPFLFIHLSCLFWSSGSFQNSNLNYGSSNSCKGRSAQVLQWRRKAEQ